MKRKIAWQSHLSLYPEQFQEQTQYFTSLIDTQLACVHSENWGFTHLTLDESYLAHGQIQLQTAQGFFPDGTFFHFDHAEGELPQALKASHTLNEKMVYLTLSGELHPKSRYRPFRKQMASAADKTLLAQISFGALQAKLVTEENLLPDSVSLPVCFIQSVTSTGINLKSSFLPPVLNIATVSFFQILLEQVERLLTERVEQVNARLKQFQTAAYLDTSHLNLLQLAHRYKAVFQHLRQQALCHPRTLHQTLYEAVAEFSSCYPDQLCPQMPVYCHDNPASGIKILFEALSAFLKMELALGTVSLPITTQNYGLWTVSIPESLSVAESIFVLGISTSLPIEHLHEELPALIKISALSRIETLISRSLPGIGVKALKVLPPQIPSKERYAYFKIENLPMTLWEEVTHSRSLAIHIGSEIPDFIVELWAVTQ